MKTATLQRYTEFLSHQGFEIESRDNAILFRDERHLFVLTPLETDPCYFSILLPGFWHPDSEEEALACVHLAHELTKGLKTTKVFLREGVVDAAVELFLPEPESFRIVFPRMLRALESAAACFLQNHLGRIAGSMPNEASGPAGGPVVGEAATRPMGFRTGSDGVSRN